MYCKIIARVVKIEVRKYKNVLDKYSFDLAFTLALLDNQASLHLCAV